jgi:hypothetical protein
MKKSIAGLLALAGLACCAQAQVVISAIYGGGSSTSTTFLSEFQYDFVELKNNSTTAQTLTGWSLQYESATGTGAWAGKINLPTVTIPAGGYYLVRTENQSGTCGAGAPCRPVDADFIATSGGGGSGTLSMAATAGKVALVNNQTLLNSDCPVGLAQVIDLIGYGNGSIPNQGIASCAETLPTNNIGNQFVIARLDLGCIDTGNNFTDTVVLGDSLNNPSDDFTPRNAASAPYACVGACPADCDNDTVCDRDEINANGGVGGIGGTLDCNSNGQLDSCEILSNPQIDCDGNQIIDSCEISSATDCDGNNQLDICQIFGNPAGLDCNNNFTLDACEINAAGGMNGIGGTLDCDATGRLDTCERAENPAFFDSNANGISDGCEVPGPGQDCNGNSRIDAWDLATYVLTDVDANGIPDTCEGAVYVEVPVNATVQNAGVRGGVNNDRFVNIEGATFAEFASYGGFRWDNATVMAGLGATATADRVYLRLVQSNAGFTNSGAAPGNDMEIFYTNNDTQDYSDGFSGTTLPNFATDYADRQSVLQYDFTRGTNPAVFGSATGNGTIESYKLFDAAGGSSMGGMTVANELNARTGSLTLVINAIPGAGDGTAATYAGWDNLTGGLFQANGPALVVFPAAGLTCDSIDFNNDGSFFDPTDIDAFLSVFSEGPCIPESATCNDIDFNNDGSLFDPCDIDSFLLQFSEGPCTACGV